MFEDKRESLSRCIDTHTSRRAPSWASGKESACPCHPKRIAAIVFLFLLLHAAPALAQDEPPRKQLTLATYNIENFFDVYNDPYTQDERTRVKPRYEIDAVAAMLRHLNADVVAVQELENEGVLRHLATDVLKDMGYRYVVAGSSNDPRGIRQGVLSRLPIDSVTSYRFRELTLDGETRTWKFARDLTHVRLKVSDTRTLDLFVVHFKSKRDGPGDPESAKWRLAEAKAARRVIDQLLGETQERWVVLLGDLNDFPGSAPLKALTEDGDAKTRLTDLHAGLDKEARQTFLNPSYGGTLDYILASAALATRVVNDSAKVVRDEKLNAGADHAPVAVTVNVEE